MKNTDFHKEILKIEDIGQKVDDISSKISLHVKQSLKRAGGVIGLSGGIDSTVTAALTVKALGASRVLGVMMPEKDSSPDSLILGRDLAKQLGINTITEDITRSLEGFQCYERRDQAVKEVYPEYDPEKHKMKIGIKKSGLSTGLPPLFQLSIVHPDGSESAMRLPSRTMRTIVAASNFKQRSRMSFLYYHAERLHYAVIGTPNKHEVDQGFFVKYGDGGADMMPIGHLYKSQVYQIAEYLDLPKEIRERTPTTDTYTAEQTQEEFFYQYPFHILDLLWYGFENGYNPNEVARVMEMNAEEVERAFINFGRKMQTTDYLRMSPVKDF